jgi:hypothetical protein
MSPSERPQLAAVVVDVSALALCDVNGNILQDNERAPSPVAQVVAPSLGLAEMGENLLRDDEKPLIATALIELGDWDIAVLGAELSPAEARKPQVAAPSVSDFGLAPAGSDLEQIKPMVKAVNPDISQLRLAD